MQLDIFDIMYEKYIITKPIRLIELFGGYGSQHLALKYLGLDVEHWKLVEWAVKSIQAYKDLHYTDINIDYSKGLTKEEIVDYLFNLGISSNYNEPMTYEQIKRINETQLRNIYNNIKITKNLVNIQNIKGKDLEIVDTDKYDYILTYSFPCQDLSLAGKRKGMSDTSTRSGLLWEVERILSECKEIGQLPQVLLMENVPQVHNTNNLQDFNKWQLRLEELGYKNYWQDLIATDYGIPQTRNRTFMISLLGDYNYTFPQPIPLKLKLKDMLEDEVDEKYYLSDKAIKGMLNTTYQSSKYENRVLGDIASTLCARDYKDPKCVEVFDFRYDEGVRGRVDTEICPTLTCKVGSSGVSGQPLLKIKEATKQGYAIAHDGDSINLEQPNSKTRRGRVGKGVAQTLMTNPQQAVIDNRRMFDENDNFGTLGTNCGSSTSMGCGVVVENYGIATNESKEWQKKPLEELSRTILSNKSNGGVGVVTIGNYSKSKHNASRIVDSNGQAPTVMENHGTVTATQTNDLRIRKLTPRECFRLMGVKDEDYERIAKNQSNSSLYHLAGDSIVVNVLMAIFKELLEDD